MRTLVAVVFTLCTLVLSRAAAQSGAAPETSRTLPDGGGTTAAPATAGAASRGNPSVSPEAGAVAPPAPSQGPSVSGSASAPAITPTGPSDQAPQGTYAAPPAPFDARVDAPALAGAATLDPPGELARAGDSEERQLLASKLQLADSWIAFEEERDRSTRTAERVFFPLLLGLEAGLGIAYAVAAEDVSQTSRILAGVTAGLALGAMVPTILSRSRSARRGWFAAGGTAFAFGAGATIITAPENNGSDERSARWVGASVALQGLALLPIGLIAGFPDEADYQAYLRLPESQRPEAAARLLARIDRFEQRVTAISLWGALAAAVVLSVGALTANERDEARTLAGLTLVPLGTIVTMFAPRLLVRGRLDRYSVGERPTKLPFNGW